MALPSAAGVLVAFIPSGPVIKARINFVERLVAQFVLKQEAQNPEAKV